MLPNKWNDEEILNKISQDINDKLLLVGELVKSDSQKNIVDSKAVKTGKLLNSMTYEVDKDEKSVKIGTNTEYAPFVELGTKFISPRFFLTNAFNENKEKIIKILDKEIK